MDTFSGNDYSLKTFSGGHGSYSSGHGDCCPLVVDPLTYSALLGFLAAAVYFFNVLIEMSMLMMRRKRRRKREFEFHSKPVIEAFESFSNGESDMLFASGSVEESNRFGCCGFSCADLRCKFKLRLIKGG